MNYEKIIKDKLNNIEYNRNDNGWKQFEKKLPKQKKSFHMLKTFIILFTLILFPTTKEITETTKTTKTTKTDIVINKKEQSIQKISTNRIYLSNNIILSENISDHCRMLPDKNNHTPQIIKKDSIINITKNKILPDVAGDTIDTINVVVKDTTIKDTTIKDTTIKDTTIKDTTIKDTTKATIYIPEAFSPNNDGLNDKFGPIGNKLYEFRYQMIIYDRWGKKLFETMRPDVKWNGKNCKDGIYIYVIRFQDETGKIKSDKGTIYLKK